LDHEGAKSTKDAKREGRETKARGSDRVFRASLSIARTSLSSRFASFVDFAPSWSKQSPPKNNRAFMVQTITRAPAQKKRTSTIQGRS
jgi:hypothetical protein